MYGDIHRMVVKRIVTPILEVEISKKLLQNATSPEVTIKLL